MENRNVGEDLASSATGGTFASLCRDKDRIIQSLHQDLENQVTLANFPKGSNRICTFSPSLISSRD